MSVEDTHLLIVFARVPRRGEVKTRLAAAIGADGALQAYRALLHRTVAVGAALPHTTRWLCLSGEDDAGECRELATRHGYRITRQVDDPDLGVRMARALAQGLEAGERVVLIGCDCPVFEPPVLADAFQRLRTHEAVFGPTEDGGYALVGANRRIGPRLPELFAGIAWSQPTVMARTRARAAQAGIRLAELATLWDVDTLEDWRRWQALAAGLPPSPTAR